MDSPTVESPVPSPVATAAAMPASRTARGRLLADRAARWAVTGGGVAIITSILGILVFILLEVWPLFGAPAVGVADLVPIEGAAPGALVSDEYRTILVSLDLDGALSVREATTGRVVERRAAVSVGEVGTGEEKGAPLPLSAIVAAPGGRTLTGATRDGRLVVVPVDWVVSFRDDVRVVKPLVGPVRTLDPLPAASAIGCHTARFDADSGVAIGAAQPEGGGPVAVVVEGEEENPFTGETVAIARRFEIDTPHRLAALMIDRDRKNLYGGSPDGVLAWWRLSEDGEPSLVGEFDAGRSITALSLLIGDRSLAVGQDDGSVSIWFAVGTPGGEQRLERIRTFDGFGSPIVAIAPSLRDKGLLAADASGGLALHYSTSHRTLWRGRSPLGPPDALFYAPKADGAFVAGGGRIAGLTIDSPHPEVGLRALFGKVWYEGYGRPEYVWQSTGGTDEYEPKLSLTPLLVGTLKGTVYSLILAIPLGVFGAMYASQFMHPDLRRFVKPTVEIMAALPSVVLGFLAGLWLAPRLESFFPALVLMTLLLPLLVLATGLAWRAVPRALRDRLHSGSEVFVFGAILAAGMWLCLRIGPVLEASAFGGSFTSWLLEATGLQYDQRNTIVVGLAMGFAVIPIIFAISEDAFSNVPRNLTSGALALGATRWQTVTRIVLPTASPGIFAAVVIGFGRAVGETMIVLMATGNTPIMDWSPFNGFRTLSANIAVEIPEAPLGGTLYRTLFLAALLLFVVTFMANTVAEIVRQRLRKRYSSL